MSDQGATSGVSRWVPVVRWLPRYRRADVNRTDGAGLGLAIVDKIMRIHHGTLELIPSDKGAPRCGQKSSSAVTWPSPFL